MRPFHYAFKIKDIPSTRAFYLDILGCKPGRYTETWIDFEFFGHQLSAHISDNIPPPDYCGKVDGISVPIPHFGCILTLEQFEEVQQKLEAAEVEFIIAPQVRYAGKTGEQRTMFLRDFSGNSLEFKAFREEGEIYA